MFFVLFLFIPVFIVFLSSLNVIKSCYVEIIAFNTPTLYGPVAFLMIMFNIKPYRRFILDLVKKPTRRSSVGSGSDEQPYSIQTGHQTGRTGSATRTAVTTLKPSSAAITRPH